MIILTCMDCQSTPGIGQVENRINLSNLFNPMRKSLPAPVNLLRQRIATRLVEQDTNDPLPIAIPAASIDESTKALLLRECHLAEDGNNEYLLYSPSSEDLKTISNLRGMHAEANKIQASNQELLQKLGMTQAQVGTVQKRHIVLLHKYNEIKDVVQAMIGMIAQHRGMMVSELYDSFDLDLND
jgi:hypothetical protein